MTDSTPEPNPDPSPDVAEEPSAGAECCGQTGNRNVLWIHTRTPEEVRALLAEEGLDKAPLVGWGARPEHANPPSVFSMSALNNAFCGNGLRVVTDGANRRWPRARPTASLICAQCGRGRCLGNPPRGWSSGRRRWYQWFTDRGVTLQSYRTTATAYDGMGVFTVAEVDLERIDALGGKR